MKNSANLTQKDLQKFRELLLLKRGELLGNVNSMESEALRKESSDLSRLPIHMADLGTDNYDQEFTLGLMDSERKILIEIDEALQRINDGTYGICLGNGKPIAKPRLEAIPWAKYSVEYAREMEKGKPKHREGYATGAHFGSLEEDEESESAAEFED